MVLLGQPPKKTETEQGSQMEQDADILAFIWNHSKVSELLKTVSFVKHRNGPLGDIEYEFDNRTCTFREMGVPVEV